MGWGEGVRRPLPEAARGRADREVEPVTYRPGDGPLVEPVAGGAGRGWWPRTPLVEPVAAVLGGLRAGRRHLVDPVGERGRVVAGQAAGTAAPGRLERHDGVRRAADARPSGAPVDRPGACRSEGRGGAGLARGGSADGRREELAEVWLSRTARSAIRASGRPPRRRWSTGGRTGRSHAGRRDRRRPGHARGWPKSPARIKADSPGRERLPVLRSGCVDRPRDDIRRARALLVEVPHATRGVRPDRGGKAIRRRYPRSHKEIAARGITALPSPQQSLPIAGV